MMDPFPEKPKGMHWKTYKKLEYEANWREDRADHSIWTVLTKLKR